MVVSSWIARLHYQPDTQTVTMTTRTGTAYRIRPVSPEQYDAWVHADSLGTWYNLNLAGKAGYDTHRCNPSELSA